MDPCTCNSVTDIAASSWFPGKNLFYSYSNCRGSDSFTSTSEATSNTNTTAQCLAGLQTCGDVSRAYLNAECCNYPSKMMGTSGLKCLDVRRAYQTSSCCNDTSALWLGVAQA